MGFMAFARATGFQDYYGREDYDVNSLRYAERLREVGVPFELHIFPDGRHGLGLAESNPHVAEWAELLRKWLIYYGWMK